MFPSLRTTAHDGSGVRQKAQQSGQGFGVGIKIVVVFCALPPQFDQAGILQDVEVAGDGGAGKAALFRDDVDPDAAAVRDLHHFQNQAPAGSAPKPAGAFGSGGTRAGWLISRLEMDMGSSFLLIRIKPFYHRKRETLHWERKSRPFKKGPKAAGLRTLRTSSIIYEANQFVGPRTSGWSCRPSSAAATVSGTREKSATREVGLPMGSSCRKGTK